MTERKTEPNVESKIATLHPEGKVANIDWAVIQLTDTCQHRCLYCGNGDGPHKNGVINEDTIEGILERFSPRKVEYTGGEPTSRMDLLLYAVDAARRVGAEEITINTNMELLSPKKITQLEETGLSLIHFALHTLDSDKHKAVRGNSRASLDKVLENFDYLLEKTELDVIVEFIPMGLPGGQTNLEEMGVIYQYVLEKRQKYGERVRSLEIGNLVPVGRATSSMCISQPEQVEEIERHIEAPKMPVEIYCYDRTSTSRLAERDFKVNTCFAGRSMFYFSTDGRVLADNFTGYVVAEHFELFDGRSPIQDVASSPSQGLTHCPFLGQP